MALSREEFSDLALRELDSVDRVARSLAASRADADDLVQETYLAAFRAFAGFTLHEFGVRPWLLRIMHNLHLNNVRKKRRQPMLMDSATLESAAPETEIAVPIPPFEGRFQDDELNRALDRMPADLRTILILWAVDEMSYKEMAMVLDIPVGTVMSRIHRARQRLYEILPNPAMRAGNGNSVTPPTQSPIQ